MFNISLIILILFTTHKLLYKFADNLKISKNITGNHRYFVNSISICNIILLLFLTIINSSTTKLTHLSTVIAFDAIVLIVILFFNVKVKAREHFEKLILLILFLITLISILITLLVIKTILLESIMFFKEIPLGSFLFGTNWDPQNDLKSEITNSFGALPVLGGTFLITIISISIATPIAILSSIAITEFSTKLYRNHLNFLIKLIAGIPSIVYGYFAVLMVAPAIKNFFNFINIDISGESAIIPSMVIAIMVIPYMVIIISDAIVSIPKSLKEGAYALGFTKTETITKVILPAIRSNIASAVLLAMSRAIGETMIVAMASGLTAKLTINPFESVTTITAQIVSMLTGDQDFGSTKTLAAFALALILFIATFIINTLAHYILKKYSIKYE